LDNNRRNIVPNCGGRAGSLPPCAPLAAAYVPVQQDGQNRYSPNEALTKGTLFPGLDLPFMDHVNKNNPYAGTPLGEIMALGFVYNELNLYLDTHPHDTEAFEYMKKIGALLAKGKETFAKKYGPLTPDQIVLCDKFTWTAAPWPWAFDQKGE